MIIYQLLFEILATLACGLFAGGALMESIVEHPGRLAGPITGGHTQFKQMLGRADPYMPILALICAASATAVTLLLKGNWLWLIEGVVLLTVVPFTLFFIVPTNRRLLDSPPQASTNSEAKTLLERWGRLHWVRSALGAAVFVALLVNLGSR